MKPVLHLRSVKANLGRIERALAKIEAKQHTLNAQWDELAELRQVLTRQLPGVMDVPDLRSHIPDHHEQPHTGYEGTGDDLTAPQATDAEQASGKSARTPEQKAALLSLIPRGPGWPRGLSRKLTPCPHSAIPHRHRVDDPSKPMELTCVGITYPEKAQETAP